MEGSSIYNHISAIRGHSLGDVPARIEQKNQGSLHTIYTQRIKPQFIQCTSTPLISGNVINKHGSSLQDNLHQFNNVWVDKRLRGGSVTRTRTTKTSTRSEFVTKLMDHQHKDCRNKMLMLSIEKDVIEAKLQKRTSQHEEDLCEIQTLKNNLCQSEKKLIKLQRTMKMNEKLSYRDKLKLDMLQKQNDDYITKMLKLTAENDKIKMDHHNSKANLLKQIQTLEIKESKQTAAFDEIAALLTLTQGDYEDKLLKLKGVLKLNKDEINELKNKLNAVNNALSNEKHASKEFKIAQEVNQKQLTNEVDEYRTNMLKLTVDYEGLKTELQNVHTLHQAGIRKIQKLKKELCASEEKVTDLENVLEIYQTEP